MRFEDFWKAVATIAIWVICGGIAIASVLASNNSFTWEMTGVPFIAALTATFILWGIPHLADSEVEKSRIEKGLYSNIADTSKPKNQGSGGIDRTSLLLELMSEEEREDFKEMLKRRVLQERRLTEDGEFFTDSQTLESLIDTPDERRENY